MSSALTTGPTVVSSSGLVDGPERGLERRLDLRQLAGAPRSSAAPPAAGDAPGDATTPARRGGARGRGRPTAQRVGAVGVPVTPLARPATRSSRWRRPGLRERQRRGPDEACTPCRPSSLSTTSEPGRPCSASTSTTACGSGHAVGEMDRPFGAAAIGDREPEAKAAVRDERQQDEQQARDGDGQADRGRTTCAGR